MNVNGHAQQHIAIADRSVQYGDGCFTTIAYINGQLEFFDAHIQRLNVACERLYIDFDNWSALKSCVFDSLHNAADCVVKIIISRGQGGRGYSPEDVGTASFIVTHHQYPSHYYQWQKEGIRLTQSAVQLARQPLLAGIKHLNRLEQVLIKHALIGSDYDDAVVCDMENKIIESSVGNLFWYKNGSWFTPDLDYAGVDGVMRNQVLSVLSNNKVKYQQVHNGVDVLTDAEEVFVCNSLMNLVPVVDFFNPVTEITTKYKIQQSKKVQTMLKSITNSQATKV